MSSTSVNNKRIAKNTLALYFRMLFLMFISLYTSRVILNALGVTDYGIYNVVGGMVVISSFFRTTMAGATQRFLSYSIGKGYIDEIQETFKTALFLHVMICLITLVLVESIGLWILNTQLIIPEERLFAANVVFQFSIVSFMYNTISVPYNAVIIAREKMGVFAYMSILEALLKLMVAYIITIDTQDRLILYGLLIMFNSIIMRSVYTSYCKRHFQEAVFSLKYNPKILKEMTGYMGWSLYANMSGAFFGQGVNIVLNMFFGPAVNAARGLAYQIQHAVRNFAINFQTAVNPQIVKYYASENLHEMYVLMKRSSRFSFYVLLIICMPVFLTTDIIFDLWLTKIPEHAIIFCQLVLIISLIDTISNPLTTATKATGKMKLNAILGGTNLLMNIPVSYVFLKYGFAPVTVFYINIFFSISGMFIRLYINRRLINFPIWDFITDVFLRGWFITILAGIVPCVINYHMPRNILTLIVVSIVSICSCLVIISFCGITSGERNFFLSKIRDVYFKIKK